MAGVAVVAMEAAACLRAVHGIRGGIEIQDEFGRRRRRVRVHEQVDEGPLHGVGSFRSSFPSASPYPRGRTSASTGCVTRVGSRHFVTQAAHRANRPVARSARTQSSRLARSTRGR